MASKKIFLIGMPGSGKSYLGNLLAKELSLPFVDLDDVIIQNIGQSIADYFSSEGEPAFRKVEQAALMETIQGNQEFVLATGGGTPCFFENLDVMKKSGMTIFLNTEKNLLLERNIASTERPLMQGDMETKIADLLKNRLSIYQQAHITTTSTNASDLITEIAKFFKN